MYLAIITTIVLFSTQVIIRNIAVSKVYFFFFFFSSRRRHTRYWRDWSSDVCSSDLLAGLEREQRAAVVQHESLVLGHQARAESGVVALDEGDDVPVLVHRGQVDGEIGRASCRERV